MNYICEITIEVETDNLDGAKQKAYWANANEWKVKTDTFRAKIEVIP